MDVCDQPQVMAGNVDDHHLSLYLKLSTTENTAHFLGSGETSRFNPKHVCHGGPLSGMTPRRLAEGPFRNNASNRR
jgi:hypothetical protein